MLFSFFVVSFVVVTSSKSMTVDQRTRHLIEILSQGKHQRQRRRCLHCSPQNFRPPLPPLASATSIAIAAVSFHRLSWLRRILMRSAAAESCLSSISEPANKPAVQHPIPALKDRHRRSFFSSFTSCCCCCCCYCCRSMWRQARIIL